MRTENQIWMDFAVEVLGVIDTEISTLQSGKEKVKLFYAKTNRSDFQSDVFNLCKKHSLTFNIIHEKGEFDVTYRSNKRDLLVKARHEDLMTAMISGLLDSLRQIKDTPQKKKGA